MNTQEHNTEELNTGEAEQATHEIVIKAIVDSLTDDEYYCMKCDRVYEYRNRSQHGCECCNSMIDDDQIAGKE